MIKFEIECKMRDKNNGFIAEVNILRFHVTQRHFNWPSAQMWRKADTQTCRN